MLVRLIAPNWAVDEKVLTRRVVEGNYLASQISKYNAQGYNVYYLPNYPSEYVPGVTVDGSMVDTFKYAFVDMDLKDGKYASKDEFIETIAVSGITPTKIVDSGNGVHVYWEIQGLDAMAYLRFQRRLMRLFSTDEAVGQIFQLMRLPGYLNTKKKDAYVRCEELADTGITYTAEEFDRLLPPITLEDEAYCQQHHDKTYRLNQDQADISDELPAKFGELLRNNKEAKELFAGETEDRSRADYRLAHIMFANGFTKDEALSVLINTVKAMARAPMHRRNYAENIADKIWTHEQQTAGALKLSSSVRDLLSRSDDGKDGKRFPCYKYVDNTVKGFRLGQVMGLVAGSGVGKTAFALNLFLGFVQSNPEYDHFFIALEQPGREIAERWKFMCGDNDRLHDKVQIIDNYDESGLFRDLSLETIKNYVNQYQKETGRKVGCVVIDHIGVLSNNNKLGQDEGVKQIAKAMKSFALETDTFLIMQSQTSREKAGIGDLELNKDAAFGTSVFENFCDYLITMWQPLKRVYAQGAPTVSAFKFCKIRHKRQGEDVIMEDVPYMLFFNPKTELLRELTQDEQTSFRYFLSQATNKRKQDRKTDLVEYSSVKWTEGVVSEAKSSDNRPTRGHGSTH